MTSGIYMQGVGSLEYTYEYHEHKICYHKPDDVVYTISDAVKTVTVGQGDVFYFPKGAAIKFEVKGPEGSHVRNFFTGHRLADTA